MKKILLCLLMAFLLSACSATPKISEEPLPPEPSSVIGSEEAGSDASTPQAEEQSAAVPQEIPLYNDYAVTLEIEPDTRIIKGYERIRFTNRAQTPLQEVVVRVYLNAFSETAETRPYFPDYESRIFKNGVDYGHMDILHVSVDNDDLSYTLDETVLTINLNEPLQVDETIQIKIQFEAYVPKIAHRTGANERALWCGNFLPVLSVYDETGWHTEPYYPAGDPFVFETTNYTVEIYTPDGYEVAGTGVKHEDLLDDRKVTVFNANMARDFAFCVSPDYKIAETVTASGVDILLYYYTDALPVNDILEAARNAAEYFETEVGAYPYGQLCIAETDMFVNGMEFSKIVFMDTAYLQRDKAFTSLVHEIGHQWFYNAVGSNQIAEAWLDEGLTMLMQELYFQPDENELHKKMFTHYQTIQSVYPTNSSAQRQWSINNNVSAYDKWSVYYQVNYVKAKLMLYKLRSLMGAEAFGRFIGEYYRAYSFKIATAADFIKKAEEVYGEDLTDFFSEWLYGNTLPDF